MQVSVYERVQGVSKYNLPIFSLETTTPSIVFVVAMAT